MTTDQLFFYMEKKLAKKISGKLTFDGSVIKYEYDGLNHLFDDLEEHLEEIAFEDKELIDEYLQKYEDFFSTEIEIHDTFAFFYIEK